MSLEHYAIHIAPRGGKIDLIVDEIDAARQAAFDERLAYSRSKGAIGLYQCEANVSALVFADNAKLPDGWAVSSRTLDGVIAAPKAKDRTKESRAQTKASKAEMAALPRIPGAREFTNRIGGSMVLGSPDGGGHGFAMRECYYHRIGETTFVMTPWSTKREETGDLTADNVVKTAFLPEGCERVPLSRYYMVKEAAELAAQKTEKVA